jgi:hypothetical protein
MEAGPIPERDATRGQRARGGPEGAKGLEGARGTEGQSESEKVSEISDTNSSRLRSPSL